MKYILNPMFARLILTIFKDSLYCCSLIAVATLETMQGMLDGIFFFFLSGVREKEVDHDEV